MALCQSTLVQSEEYYNIEPFNAAVAASVYLIFIRV